MAAQDGKRLINLHFTAGQVFVWNPDEVDILQRQHHIVGSLIGALPGGPRQNAQLGLPLQLMPEEAAVLLKHGVARLVTMSVAKPTPQHVRDFQERRKESIRDQKALWKQHQAERREELRDVIEEGRMKKKEKMKRRKEKLKDGEIKECREKEECKVEKSGTDGQKNENAMDACQSEVIRNDRLTEGKVMEDFKKEIIRTEGQNEEKSEDQIKISLTSDLIVGKLEQDFADDNSRNDDMSKDNMSKEEIIQDRLKDDSGKENIHRETSRIDRLNEDTAKEKADGTINDNKTKMHTTSSSGVTDNLLLSKNTDKILPKCRTADQNVTLEDVSSHKEQKLESYDKKQEGISHTAFEIDSKEEALQDLTTINLELSPPSTKSKDWKIGDKHLPKSSSKINEDELEVGYEKVIEERGIVKNDSLMEINKAQPIVVDDGVVSVGEGKVIDADVGHDKDIGGDNGGGNVADDQRDKGSDDQGIDVGDDVGEPKITPMNVVDDDDIKDKGCSVQLFTAEPRNSEYIIEVPLRTWHYPSNEREELRYRVFLHFWEMGYFITSGTKFGGDFLVYPGDPFLFHSYFIVVCVPFHKKFTALDLVSHGRLGTFVKKTVVLCSLDSEKRVVTTSLQWSGVS